MVASVCTRPRPCGIHHAALTTVDGKMLGLCGFEAIGVYNTEETNWKIVFLWVVGIAMKSDICYKPTASSAIAYSDNGRLEEWIHLFLCGEGNNESFSNGLKLERRRYHGPRMMELNTFSRDCGPEEGMKWRIGEDGFNSRVNEIMNRFKKGDWDMPPLIVYHDGIKYGLNDGNHRHEALRRLNINSYWVILWETVDEYTTYI